MRLMGKMLRDPQIRANSTAADQYFVAHDNQSMGRFARLFLMWERADSASANLIGQLGSLEGQRDSLSLRLDAADSLLASGVLTPAQAAAWTQSRLDWAMLLGGLQMQMNGVNRQIVQQRLARYQAALTFNNSIPVSVVHESNLKSLNAALLHLAIDGVYRAADVTALEGMAAQDPEIGGEAVLSAGFALPGTCANGQQQRMLDSRTKKAQPLDLRLSPVPASEVLSVEFGAGAAEGSWQVVDMSGRLLRSGQQAASDAALVLPVGDLPGGMYAFRFRSTDGALAVRRFTVIR